MDISQSSVPKALILILTKALRPIVTHAKSSSTMETTSKDIAGPFGETVIVAGVQYNTSLRRMKDDRKAQFTIESGLEWWAGAVIYGVKWSKAATVLSMRCP